MNNLNLIIEDKSSLEPVVFIDNSIVETRRNNRDINISYQTDKSEIEVSICRYLELSNKLWWLFALFFFVISIFGIFNPHYDKKCIQIDYKFKVKLKENSEIRIDVQKIGTKAIAIESNCEYEISSNFLSVDKRAKKRLRTIKFLEVLAWIGIVIVGIFLIVNNS